MPGKLQFDLAAYQEAAHKYRPELLMLPIIGIKDTLKFMTARPGIRYKESVAAVNGTAQFGPYKPSRSTDFNLNLNFRTLETFMGSVVAKFEPNSAISTVLGQMAASKGDGQMKAPTALHVLRLIALSLSEHLNDAIWKGVRNPEGDTSLDLFDGFDTITTKEITAGKIAAGQGNVQEAQGSHHLGQCVRHRQGDSALARPASARTRSLYVLLAGVRGHVQRFVSGFARRSHL